MHVFDCMFLPVIANSSLPTPLPRGSSDVFVFSNYSSHGWIIRPQINTSDHSDSQWMTCFQDTGSEILRKSAQELGELRESDENTFDSLFQEANFKEYVFRTRAKMDTYNVRCVFCCGWRES